MEALKWSELSGAVIRAVSQAGVTLHRAAQLRTGHTTQIQCWVLATPQQTPGSQTTDTAASMGTKSELIGAQPITNVRIL